MLTKDRLNIHGYSGICLHAHYPALSNLYGITYMIMMNNQSVTKACQNCCCVRVLTVTSDHTKFIT